MRYFLKISQTISGLRCDTFEDKDGMFVDYDDYARLKAECQARQAENSVLAVECDSLKAEVERLTKAGDKMAHIHRFVGFPSYTLEWEAAKKGGQP